MSRAPRFAMVRDYTAQLVNTFGGVRAPVPDADLRNLYAAGKFPEIVWRIRDDLLLSDIRARVAIVRSGGPDAPAWVVGPDPMPIYGTREFKSVTVTVFLRREFLTNPMETVCLGVAHELAHVVLESLRHPLKNQEEAVDLTAMILGYRQFFAKGQLQLIRQGADGALFDAFGYLEPEEMVFASQLMSQLAIRK